MLGEYKIIYINNQSFSIQAKAPGKGNGKNILHWEDKYKKIIWYKFTRKVQNIYEQNYKNILGKCKTKVQTNRKVYYHLDVMTVL